MPLGQARPPGQPADAGVADPLVICMVGKAQQDKQLPSLLYL
ncbi:MAG: hypothetical protein KatS3mg051_2199 [Anaerolineae bacterium]|nr:MAG: hypothetical protein KatS3mg051_2199 [Anaerolineae bacterium]